MTQTLESGYRSTLAAKLNASDITITVATAPTVTAGRMHIYRGATHAWIKYTGVSSTTLTGVTFVSQTADPATTVAGVTFPAGTSIELVEMHDQMFDKQAGGTIPGASVFSNSLKVPVYADATARDAAITVPANGMEVYLTAEGYFTDYQGGAWGARDTGTVTPNGSTTVAGKYESATDAEVIAGTTTGGTGATLVFTPAQLQTEIGLLGFFGTGADGDVTITTTVTLTTLKNYNNLTITSPGILITNGYKVYVKGTLTIGAGGIIHDDGNAGAQGDDVTNNSFGNGGAAGVAKRYGGAGGLGRTTDGGGGQVPGNGNAIATYQMVSTAAGAGGGGVQAGGTAPTGSGAVLNVIQQFSHSVATVEFGGGVGGGGGGGGSYSGGGGGGGGGGFVFLSAKAIANAGTIRALGGAGGRGGNNAGTGTAACCSGGGGGTGGLVFIYTLAYTGAGTTAVTGGTGGVGGLYGTGAVSQAASGSNGGAGLVVTNY